MEGRTTGATAGLHDIDCIFCGGGASSGIVIEENGFTGRQCHGCGLVFVSPRPSLDDIINLYGHDSAHISAGIHLASGFAKRLYARNSLRIIRRHRKGGDLLEVGAGAGFFLDEARRAGFNPFAIEFNGIQAAHIRDVLGIPCASVPLAAAPFPDRQFDVVYHCDVVSHLHDPIADFRRFNAALGPDGLMVFETGNIGDMRLRDYGLFSRFQYPDHLFFFSTRNISQLLESTGFELVEIHRYAILPELRLERWRRKVRKWFRGRSSRGRGEDTAPVVQGTQQAHRGKGGLLQRLKTADQYVNYLIRYGLGRVYPKGRRPQTMVIVARKRSLAPQSP